MMKDKLSRFLSANAELSTFLRRVEGLSQGTDWITECDLQIVSDRIATLNPELQSSSREASGEHELQREVAQYIDNLRSLQRALQKVHCIMLARKTQLDTDRKHLCGLNSWLSAYHQTA